MNANNYVTETKKVRSVTRLPGWILKIMGYIDSDCGERVCDDYLEKLHYRMMRFAREEDNEAENALLPLKIEAKEIMERMQKNKEALLQIPPMEFGDSPEVIRENRKIDEQIMGLKAALWDDTCLLTAIPEKMMAIETKRSICIDALKLKCDEKAKCYIKGIHEGRLKEYKAPEFIYDDSAKDLYKEEYNAMKEKIQAVLSGKEEI